MIPQLWHYFTLRHGCRTRSGHASASGLVVPPVAHSGVPASGVGHVKHPKFCTDILKGEGVGGPKPHLSRKMGCHKWNSPRVEIPPPISFVRWWDARTLRHVFVRACLTQPAFSFLCPEPKYHVPLQWASNFPWLPIR